MPRYVLDTNVLIDALNHPGAREETLAFLRWALPRVWLSAVVLHELEAGSTGPQQQALLEQHLVGPFERRQRILAPSVGAWRRAGQVIRRGLRVESPAALNDLLLAVSCRDAGAILVTRDRGLARLGKHIPGLQVAAPYPAPGRPARR